MVELRVSGGELAGRRLRAPRGARIRPTTERVREALFSILGDLDGLRVLDLFCGTGALGIEALSRGAASATLVDSDARVARRNVAELGLGDRAEVVRADALRYLRRAPAMGFDLVLCDPPYRLADRLGPDLEPLIERALDQGGRVVVESSSDSPLELGLPLVTARRYGDTALRIHARRERE
jgi:16S rRNA (guanine966-N2)-methyltransferase